MTSGREWPAELRVEDRPDGLRTVADDGRAAEWRGTPDALHTELCRRGYKRIGKQVGSDIGGVYVQVTYKEGSGR